MDRLLTFLLIVFSTTLTYSQTEVLLSITNMYESEEIKINEPYRFNGSTISFSRITYYIDDIQVEYNQGETRSFEQTILCNGVRSSTSLGVINDNIYGVSSIQFSVGLNASNNATLPQDHLNTSALFHQNPPMYSYSNNSYIFSVIEGLIDNDDDGYPETPFVLRATGDQLLASTSVEVNQSSSQNTAEIQLNCVISSWLEDLDLSIVSIQENSGTHTTLLMDNVSLKNVFQASSATSIGYVVSPDNRIVIDSRQLMHPTIYYTFFTNELIDMTISNLAGSYFIQLTDLSPFGYFQINDPIPSGMYLVMFSSKKGIRQIKKFVVN